MKAEFDNFPNIFSISYSEIENRLDPLYCYNKKYLMSTFKFPLEKIGNSFIVKDGDHDKLPPEEISSKEIGKRYLRAQDLKENQIIENNPVYISNDYFQKISRCHIYPGDLLISIMASIGASAIVPSTFPICTANRAVGILRQKNNSILSPEYIQAFINTEIGFSLFELEKKGGIQQRLNLSDISNVKVPAPPFDLQEQISKIYMQGINDSNSKIIDSQLLLKEIDSYLLSELGINLPQQNDNVSNRIFEVNYRDLSGDRFDSYFNSQYFIDAFLSIRKSFFECVQLKNVISFIESGSRPVGGVGNIEEGILSFGGEHVNDKCEIEIKKPKYIPFEFHEKNLKTKTELYDILLVKDGATTGKIGIIENEEHVGHNINEHVFMIKTNEHINAYYLAYYLHSEAAQIQISRGITGATVTGLTKGVVRDLYVPIPPLNKQNEIATYIQEIRKKANSLRKESIQILDDMTKVIEKMIIG